MHCARFFATNPSGEAAVGEASVGVDMFAADTGIAAFAVAVAAADICAFNQSIQISTTFLDSQLNSKNCVENENVRCYES